MVEEGEVCWLQFRVGEESGLLHFVVLDEQEVIEFEQEGTLEGLAAEEVEDLP